MLGFKSRYPHKKEKRLLNNLLVKFFIIVIYHIIEKGDEKIVKIEAKPGDRVELLEMEDTLSRLKKGDKGTVIRIDEEEDLIWVDWDNGERLALLADIDKYKIVK